ncbi:Tnks [Symbiodinium necroappetens]|uniref:Tnks protein n=1 Tax=Symbiodinium necroappetens TaxID=1628268 RepID=A0A813C200_9DINO|nr:Tnks [Symbiodinium necroappetens]
MAKADGDDDWWYPSRQVPKPQNPECDSAVDLLKSMVDADRHFEIVLGAVLFIAVLGALGSSCFLIGGKVKPRPPGYWTSRSWNPFHDDFRAEVDVTMELRDTVQQLFDMTTRKEAMGIGRDGSWATHKSFRVLQVTRVENGKLWTDYVRFRRNISRTQATMRRMEKEGAPCRAELKRTQEALQARRRHSAVSVFLGLTEFGVRVVWEWRPRPYKTNQSLEQLRRPPCVQGHFDLNLFWNDEVHIGRPWREKGVRSSWPIGFTCAAVHLQP